MLATLNPAQTESSKPFSRLGIAIKASSLGFSVEAATPVTLRSNLRAGFNIFSYDHTFHKDGVGYAGQLRFRSIEGHYDWFPFAGSFHLSPGELIYNGNQLAANASVPGGNTFTRNHTTTRAIPPTQSAAPGRSTSPRPAPCSPLAGETCFLATTDISASRLN
jgi:hypothetical protein